jgi:hypothetical protein
LRVRRCRKCEQTADSTEFREKLASRWHFHANLHLGPHDGPIPLGRAGRQLNRDFRDKSVYLQDGRLLAAVVSNADAAPLDRNVQSRKIIHAAPLLLNREMCGCDLVTRSAVIRRASSRVSRFGRRAMRRSDMSGIAEKRKCAACA